MSPQAIARVGILLGAFAFWLALPPVASSAVVWLALVGGLAVACGVWAARQGQRRLAWGAIAAGVLGASLGVLFPLLPSPILGSLLFGLGGAGLLVSRMLGLRNPEQFTATSRPAGAPAWVAGAYTDAGGTRWFELDLPSLVREQRFLEVGA